MKSSIISRNKRYTNLVQALLQELAAYDDKRLNQKPADGGWSAIQTMHHLILSEEYSMSYIRKKMGFTNEFEDNNWSARMRSFLLWASLASPFKFKAPVAIGTEKLPEYATLTDTREHWEQARADWEVFFEQLPEALSNKLVYKHPRAGKITFMQMLWFFETHFQRHKKQIYRCV